MTLLYASTFTDALGKLTAQEQKQVRDTTEEELDQLFDRLPQTSKPPILSPAG